MQLETINKLYLELSQIATAKTKEYEEMEHLLCKANGIFEKFIKGETIESDKIQSLHDWINKFLYPNRLKM